MPIDPQVVVADARAKAAIEAVERRRQERSRALKHSIDKNLRESFLTVYLRSSKGAEYTEWLRGWLQKGGKIGHVRDYPSTSQHFYVAARDIEVVPKLYGALAINVVVPKGIKAPRLEGHMPYGHSYLYFVDGYELYGANAPDVFSDTRL